MEPKPRTPLYNLRMMADRRGAFVWLIVCWALLGAVGCAYQFFWSTFPVTSVDEPPGPHWVVLIGDLVSVLGVLYALCSVGLLLAGLIRLRRTKVWAGAWAGASAVALTFEVMIATSVGVPWVSPTYSGPAVLDWVYLAECAGFLVIGATLVWVVGCGTHADPRRLLAGGNVRP
jgi:hypothetical protein